jgi:endonuclease/exonuclease/phosphatase family metal-dependent hydrolase
MPEQIRIATYNCEWFNALFNDRGRLLADGEPSTRYKTTRGEQAAALGIVFNAIDADAVMVIEAPDTNGKRSSVTALERFAQVMGLRARRAVTGYASETEQEIALLYDPDRLSVQHDPQGRWPIPLGSNEVPRFDGQFRAQTMPNTPPDLVRFVKPPLELSVTTAGGQHLRMIGVHVKSKAPHGVRGEQDAIRVGIENRRKQLGQCLWLRARVEAHLVAGDPLIVLGDFNDGPGLDEYESQFGRSGVEVTMGTGDEVRLYDPHAQMALATRIGVIPTSARFYLAPAKRYFEAMLDFIMVSPDLAAKGPVWRIWHPFNDPGCWKVPELRDALLTASDHFPVTLDVVV